MLSTFATGLQNKQRNFANEILSIDSFIFYLCSQTSTIMNKKLLRIIVTAVLLAAAYVIQRLCELPLWQLLLVYLVPYLLISYDVLHEAAEGILEGEVFNEDFLMCVATIGALAIGFLPGAEPEFVEAVFVMLFFQLGELFEDYAEDKSRDSISHLMDMRPDSACVMRDGEEKTVNPDEVGVGETIIVRPGEKIPLDGVIERGTTSINTMALTGESMPLDAGVGDEVMSGCVNVSGVIRVKTTKPFAESTVSRILDIVENSQEKKSRSESFITRFARVYTPVVVIAAVLFAFVPPFFYPSYSEALSLWLLRALTFLVVSCPCALVISVPLAFFAGIGGASRRGILIKGGNYMDVLAKAEAVVFDKTGTLTRGQFSVTVVHPTDFDPDELLHLAAHVEHYSTHPIAVALKLAYPKHETDDCEVTDINEYAGKGITANVAGHQVAVGNAALMRMMNLNAPDCEHDGTLVHVAVDGVYAGHIAVADTVKEHSADAISLLRNMGISNTVMLTGDREKVARKVAAELSVGQVFAGLLPDQKVGKLEQVMAQTGGSVLFVGDGVNDAPVLARADVGIAMGALGSDAAIDAADVVLMDDDPSKIATAIQIARRTVAIAQQNVVFAIAVKLIVLVMAAFGLAPMWLAVFADVGVTVLAVLNSMRALAVK